MSCYTRCYFCGSDYGCNEKIRFKGKRNGKRVQVTTYICPMCSMAENKQLEKELDWDDDSLSYEGVDRR